MRVMGVDLGRRRIGLAFGETELAVASPRPPILASGSLAADARVLDAIARREEAEAIVVGVPRGGADDRQEQACLRLAEELEALGWRVERVDESLTTVEAHAELREIGLTHAGRKRRVDGVAACRILERYFALGRPAER